MGLLHEYGNSQIVIHLLAPPARGRGVLVDLDVLLSVVFHQLVPVGQRSGVIGGYAVEALAVRFDETHGAIIQDLHDHPALVDLAVMESAHLDEVGQLGLAALGPMVDVVGVNIVRVRAAGKSAAAIARVQRAAQCRWY